MFLDKYKLDGKIAMITGGAKGIGFSIAHALGEAGAKLVLIDRENSKGGVEELAKANYDVSFLMPQSLKEALELSNSNNPSLAIARINLAISEKELNVEKARLSPSATLNYSKTENKDFSSTIDEKDDETVKATITWPIIKGGENISSIKKSSFDKQRAQLVLQDTKSKITSDTSNAWSKYQSSRSVLDATKAQLKAAEIANEGITLEYDSGSSRTTLEVVQSRSLLLDARISFAKAQRDFMVSQFELAKQIGTLSLSTIK